MGVLNEMRARASSAAATDRTGGRVNLLRMMSAYEIVLERHGLAPIEDTRFYQLLLNLSMMPESDWSEKRRRCGRCRNTRARIHWPACAARASRPSRAASTSALAAAAALPRAPPARPPAGAARRRARRRRGPAGQQAGGADERADVADAAARGERGGPARRGVRGEPGAAGVGRRLLRARRALPGGKARGGGRDLDGRHRRAPAPHTTLRRVPGARCSASGAAHHAPPPPPSAYGSYDVSPSARARGCCATHVDPARRSRRRRSTRTLGGAMTNAPGTTASGTTKAAGGTTAKATAGHRHGRAPRRRRAEIAKCPRRPPAPSLGRCTAPHRCCAPRQFDQRRMDPLEAAAYARFRVVAAIFRAWRDAATAGAAEQAAFDAAVKRWLRAVQF